MKRTIYVLLMIPFSLFLFSCNSTPTKANGVIVHFDSMGGTDVDSQYILLGNTVSIPEVSREGYSLEGWYTSLDNGETFSRQWSFATDVISNDITLYAKWLEILPTDIYEYVIEGGEVHILGYLGHENSLNIPSEIEGYPVTIIGHFAFSSQNLTSVTIPNSVTTIGMDAFRDNKLSRLIIPDSVTTIGSGAFYSNEITSVTIPNSVTIIEDHAFGWNNLMTVMIPEGVTTIGEGAFYNNEITSVTLPQSVTTIENLAFELNDLTSVSIPDGIAKIGTLAFDWSEIVNLDFGNSESYIYENNLLITSNGKSIIAGVGSLSNITIPDGVSTIGGYAFLNNNLTSVTMSDGVTTIGDSAFEGNHLTSIEFPISVTTIGKNAFNWNDLTSITIPDYVETIGAMAFEWDEIESFDIGNNENFIYENNLLLTSDGNTILAGVGPLINVIIPEGVSRINSYAFASNNLTSVTIPEGVTIIGSSAFAWNDLTSVTISESVITIGQLAFIYNDLISITILGDEKRFNAQWSLIGFKAELKPS